MTEINFQPVFEYIDKNNQVLKEEILFEIRHEFNGKFDGIAKQLQYLIDEMHSNNYRVTRLENWAGPVSKKVKIPLDR